ncbi:MAG: discoidin domain-containing protein, partial [Clostridia bacterium]|nr:discoidin domain-containing protein [Clostridia bacterium]
MKKVLSLVLCFVLVAVMALPALAASFTVNPENGNASYENAYGYVFDVDLFNDKSVAEKNVIFTDASQMGDWWQFVALEKVEGDTYVAVNDSILWKDRAADFALEEGQIILVCHSSSSKPPEEAKKFPEFATYFETDGTYKYPNWQNKIALMAVKAGDYLTFSGVDFAAGTVAADATATCTAENPVKPADKVINLLTEAGEIILTSDGYNTCPNDKTDIVASVENGVFTAQSKCGFWPNAEYRFTTPVTVAVEGAYLEVEVAVSGGTGASIRLLGTDSAVSTDDIFLHQFDEGVTLDAGSGDASGDFTLNYKLALKDMAFCDYRSEVNYAGKLPITSEEVTFSGVFVCPVGNATATVTKLNLIVPAEGGEEEVVTENKKVSDGASYTTSQLFRQNNSTWSWDETCEIAYPDSGNELFDGVFPPAEDHELYDSNAGAWMGFHSQCPDYEENGYAWIKIDLGKSYDLTDVVLYTASSLISSATASNIKVLVSEDGETWADFGSVNSVDDTSVTVIKNTVTGSASGRYVEIRMTAAGHWLGVCEVEVFADVVVSGGTTEPEEEADTSLMGDAPERSAFTATVSGPEAWKAGDKVTIDVTIEVT